MSNCITISPSRKNFNCFFKIEQQAGYTSRNVHNRAQNRTHDRGRYPDSSRRPRNRNRASHARFLPQQDCFPSADQTDRARKPDNPLRGHPLAAAERTPRLCNRAADAPPAFRQRNAPAADTAARLVHERHLLLGFGGKLPQKGADRLQIRSGNAGLLLHKIPVTDALVVANLCETCDCEQSSSLAKCASVSVSPSCARIQRSISAISRRTLSCQFCMKIPPCPCMIQENELCRLI